MIINYFSLHVAFILIFFYKNSSDKISWLNCFMSANFNVQCAIAIAVIRMIYLSVFILMVIMCFIVHLNFNSVIWEQLKVFLNSQYDPSCLECLKIGIILLKDCVKFKIMLSCLLAMDTELRLNFKSYVINLVEFPKSHWKKLNFEA